MEYTLNILIVDNKPKNLVTAVGKLGRAIWVESTPGEGSTFFITLPKAS